MALMCVYVFAIVCVCWIVYDVSVGWWTLWTEAAETDSAPGYRWVLCVRTLHLDAN